MGLGLRPKLGLRLGLGLGLRFGLGLGSKVRVGARAMVSPLEARHTAASGLRACEARARGRR